MLKMSLEELRLMEEQIDTLDKEMAGLLEAHQQAIRRLAEVPGLGCDSAQQIIVQVGPTAATFPSAKDLSSWVGVCSGDNVSAEESKSSRSPKGNRTLRRLLNQAANAAVRMKGTIFEFSYRRMVPRMGHNKATWAIAHRLCKLIWKILHEGVRYEERGPAVSAKSRKIRTDRLLRELRALGYRVEFPILRSPARDRRARRCIFDPAIVVLEQAWVLGGWGASGFRRFRGWYFLQKKIPYGQSQDDRGEPKQHRGRSVQEIDLEHVPPHRDDGHYQNHFEPDVMLCEKCPQGLQQFQA